MGNRTKRTNSPWLTVPELAEYWNVEKDFVRGLIRSNRLPATNLGDRQTRIHREAVAEYERRRTTARHLMPASSLQGAES